MTTISSKQADQVLQALDSFDIELPSWGFADTGTRFGKFPQDAAASTIEEKIHDVGLVNKLTGTCPTVAVHVLWDFKQQQDPSEVAKLAEQHGVRIGSINPTLFQDEQFKFGSFCSPWEEARSDAMAQTQRAIDIGKTVGSQALAMWLADGTNFPGQDSIYRRKQALQNAYKQIAEDMAKRWPEATMLIEYKPFEPAWYHTDIADWGMSYVLCKHAGPNAKVLVDTGHHLPGANIEHIVAFLLDENMLGGFHFNDRKYADDDLTLGSIDPYGVFRIFDQIAQHTHDTGKPAEIAYMIDQCHNLKPKLEAMVLTVTEAQKLYAKAHCVDRAALADAQARTDIVAAEQQLKQAYETDVSDILTDWRKKRNLPADPFAELRAGGYVEKLGRERRAAREARGESRQTTTFV